MSNKRNKWIDSPAPGLSLPDLKGRNAVVTGAAQGIGLAVVKGLLSNGARVFGLDVRSGPARHRRFTPVVCDLRDTSSILRSFARISSDVSSLDYVVNVAGMDPKYRIEEITAAQWDELINLNLRAYYFVIKHALPLLRRGKGRSIVNVSSINYRLGVPGRAPYSALHP